MNSKDTTPHTSAPVSPLSRRLREIMDTPPGFWLSKGIALTFLLFAIIILILWLVPLDRFGGVSLINHLLS